MLEYCRSAKEEDKVNRLLTTVKKRALRELIHSLEGARLLETPPEVREEETTTPERKVG